MITIKTDQYVKDEGNEGKTIFTFTITATDLFQTDQGTNGNQAKLKIQLLDKGMDGSDGLKLVADATNGVTTTSALDGFISFDRDKDKHTSETIVVKDDLFGEEKTTEYTQVTYTKTIKVEINGDADIEAHEMFGLGITQGWMMQDGKTTNKQGGEKDGNIDFPAGNFNVNAVALQVVRNDDGEAKPGDTALGALAEQVEKITGDREQVDFAGKRLVTDVDGEGSKSEPTKPSELTPEEKKAESEAQIRELLEMQQQAKIDGDEKRVEELEKEIEEEFLRLGEHEEAIDKNNPYKSSFNKNAPPPDQDGPIDFVVLDTLLNMTDPGTNYMYDGEPEHGSYGFENTGPSYFDYDTVA